MGIRCLQTLFVSFFWLTASIHLVTQDAAGKDFCTDGSMRYELDALRGEPVCNYNFWQYFTIAQCNEKSNICMGICDDKYNSGHKGDCRDGLNNCHNCKVQCRTWANDICKATATDR